MSISQRAPALLSSRSIEWPTPRALLRELETWRGPWTLDAASTAEFAVCRSYLGPDHRPGRRDALELDWADLSLHVAGPEPSVWLNPPYGRTVGRFVDRAVECAAAGVPVTCLVPARTDTRWWHRLVEADPTILFLKGRLHFGDKSGRAPFPSAIVLLGGRQEPPIGGRWHAVRAQGS